jgi:hypothetical protein
MATSHKGLHAFLLARETDRGFSHPANTAWGTHSGGISIPFTNAELCANAPELLRSV